MAYQHADEYAALGNLDGCAHAANVHIYTAAGSTSDKQIKSSMALARPVVPGDPIFVTEIGHHTLKTVPTVGTGALAQAKLTLSELLGTYQNGASMTYLYELFDNNTGAEAQEAHFGLFYADGVAKPSANALRKMMAILSYNDTGRVDGKIGATYSIDSASTSVHAMRLEKSSSYVIAVWNDIPVWRSSTSSDVVNPVVKTVVKFGHVAKTVFVYDPVKKLAPIAKYTNTASIEIPLMDRPLLIEVNATREVPSP